MFPPLFLLVVNETLLLQGVFFDEARAVISKLPPVALPLQIPHKADICPEAISVGSGNDLFDRLHGELIVYHEECQDIGKEYTFLNVAIVALPVHRDVQTCFHLLFVNPLRHGDCGNKPVILASGVPLADFDLVRVLPLEHECAGDGTVAIDVAQEDEKDLINLRDHSLLDTDMNLHVLIDEDRTAAELPSHGIFDMKIEVHNVVVTVFHLCHGIFLLWKHETFILYLHNYNI